jgi:hypothetical protein
MSTKSGSEEEKRLARKRASFAFEQVMAIDLRDNRHCEERRAEAIHQASLDYTCADGVLVVLEIL